MKNLGTQLLISSRLVLRKFELNDLDQLLSGFINQEEFLYYSNKERKNKFELQEHLNEIINNYNRLDYYNWLITINKITIVGSINVKINNNEGLISYALDKRYLKNGYMKEALETVLNFMLNEVKIDKIFGRCVINNKASFNVMKNCNMNYLGIKENCIKLKDGVFDAYEFCVSKND